MIYVRYKIITVGEIRGILMEKEIKFEIDVFELIEPIFIVGRSIRIPVAGTPECFRAIGELYTDFFKDNTVALIPKKKETVIYANKGHFGLCYDHIQNGDSIEFTYAIGIQILEFSENNELPKNMQKYIIPKGMYARISVSAPPGTAEGIAWMELDKWNKKALEWEYQDSIYEVYVDKSNEWMEFELWRSILKKK
jgi:predicted transcriptional regulator YdeE